MKSSPRVVEAVPHRLALLDRLPRRGIVAEIGVQRGHFAAEILRRCDPKLLLLVDGWRYRDDPAYRLDKSNVSQSEHDAFYAEVCERFRAEMYSGRVIVLRGLSNEVLPLLPDGWLDWVYLDADHTYSAVSEDLRWCSRKVKDTGLICGHDYTEAPEQGFGVIRAVGDFCDAFGWEFALRTFDDPLCGGYDSYVLRRDPDVGRRALR